MPSPFLPGTLNHIDNFGIWGKTSTHTGKKSPLSMKAVFLEGQTFLVWLCLPPPTWTLNMEVLDGGHFPTQTTSSEN